MEKQQQQPQENLASVQSGTPTNTSSRGTHTRALADRAAMEAACEAKFKEALGYAGVPFTASEEQMFRIGFIAGCNYTLADVSRVLG